MTSDLTPAFILHTRPYKENQLLIECLVAGKGRISIVGYKGSQKNSAKTALFRPFRPLLVAYNKTSGLRTLKQVEANRSLTNSVVELGGKCLFSAFYINEITCRLCTADAEYEGLYPLYVYALQLLSELSQAMSINTDAELNAMKLEWVLRQFEYKLLELLGYGIRLDADVDIDEPLQVDNQYSLYSERGVSKTHFNTAEGQAKSYLGEDLLSLSQRLESNLQTLDYQQYDEPARLALKKDLVNAKQILRHCLQLHLGDKPIKSRELFRK